MATSGFTQKVITPEGANRPCRFPKLEQQGAAKVQGGRWWSDTQRLQETQAVRQWPPLPLTTPWKPAKHWKAACVHAHESWAGRGCWHKCLTVVTGKNVAFPTACPRGHESLLGAPEAGRGSPSGQTAHLSQESLINSHSTTPILTMRLCHFALPPDSRVELPPYRLHWPCLRGASNHLSRCAAHNAPVGVYPPQSRTCQGLAHLQHLAWQGPTGYRPGGAVCTLESTPAQDHLRASFRWHAAIADPREAACTCHFPRKSAFLFTCFILALVWQGPEEVSTQYELPLGEHLFINRILIFAFREVKIPLP